MKMKRHLFVSAVALFSLASCTMNEISVDRQDSNAIGFDTYAGNAASTRASIVDAKVMETATYAGIGVFAYHNAPTGLTSSDLMYNQLVKWDATLATPAWTYSPIKYWPTMATSTVDFYGYAPYGVASGTFTNDMASEKGVKLPFTVKTEIKEQEDLLIAYKPAAIKTDGTVVLPFIHALSRIGVKVSYLVDGAAATLPSETTITINSITLGNVEKDSQTATNAFYASGTVDLSKALTDSDLWTSLATKYNKFTYDAATFFGSKVELNATEKTIENAADSYLMVIPQNLSALPVNVVYTVTTTDSNNPANSSTVTNSITTNVDLDMKAGTAYVLNIKVGLNAIVLDVDETKWTTPGEEVTVPVQ